MSNDKLKSDREAPGSWNSSQHQRRRKYRWLIAASHHITVKLGKWFPNAFPFVYLSGYPKSGTSWAADLIADALGISHPQHSLMPLGSECVVQTHSRFDPKCRRAVYVMRDGRDVMVSLYFHLIGNREACGTGRNPYQGIRGLGTAQSIRDDLPEFIAGQFDRPFGSPLNWADHVTSYLQSTSDRLSLVRYEDLKHDAIGTVARTIATLTSKPVSDEKLEHIIARHSFSKPSSQKTSATEPSSFLRKGIAGDWRNHFSEEACEQFDRSFGDALLLAGYESDRSWTRSSIQKAA
ncbi:MAG: sulfotransferase domain-containing protein [Planctomycetaceae bacterium]